MANQTKDVSKRKLRRLTLPLFSLKHTPKMEIEVTGAFHETRMPGLSKNEDGMVTILPCIQMETGEEGLLLSYATVQSAIERSGTEYIGRKFLIERGDLEPGKDYYHVDVFEIVE